MKLMQVFEQESGDPERIAYINPRRITSITKGRLVKSDPEFRETYDYETIIHCGVGFYYGCKDDIEVVKTQVEKMADTRICVDPDGILINPTERTGKCKNNK